jgi:Ca2+-binding EF-hand superfamily protein
MTSKLSTANGSLRTHDQPRVELAEERRLEIKEARDIVGSDTQGSINRDELRAALAAMGFDVSKYEIV